MVDARGGPARWPLYITLLPILALDQGLKAWASDIYGGVHSVAPPLLTIRVVHNRGVLFGLGERAGEASWLVNGAVIVVLLVLVGFAVRLDAKKRLRHLGIACMIGGALGNFLDRLIHGYVVDYLQILFLPILNLADLAVFAGVGMILFDLFRTPTATHP